MLLHILMYLHILLPRLVKTLVADSPLTAVDFMPDGASLAIGSSRGKIYQYDLRMLKSPVKTISAHKTSVQCIAFQYSTSLTKASLNKGCSNKATAANKRSVPVGSSSGAATNPEMSSLLSSFHGAGRYY